MSTLYVMEEANLFCGSHDPANSQHLSIRELKLPALQATYSEHAPGGSKFKIEIETGFDVLKPTFKLSGFDPELLKQFGLNTRIKHTYTAYGVIRNRRTGAAIELRAVMEARLGKIDPSAHQNGELQTVDYELNELTHYELHFAGEELLYWDFWTNAWRVDGVDQNSEVNSILRIPRSA